MKKELHDNHYYHHTGNLNFAQRVSSYARNIAYNEFINIVKPTSTESILDLGVTDVDLIDSNTLERNYKHQGKITCASLSDGTNIKKMFPCAHHVQIKAHEPLPFPDNHFDIGYSNAVIEHVGSLKNQKDFISEICRVSKRTFIIAPNRWFPVEHHTCLPFIHYLPKYVFRAIISKSRFAQWSLEQNLNHISLKFLEKPQCEKACIKSGYTGIGIGVLKSNLFAYYI